MATYCQPTFREGETEAFFFSIVTRPCLTATRITDSLWNNTHICTHTQTLLSLHVSTFLCPAHTLLSVSLSLSDWLSEAIYLCSSQMPLTPRSGYNTNALILSGSFYPFILREITPPHLFFPLLSKSPCWSRDVRDREDGWK